MTEFFEFGSYESVETLSDLGSSRYEATNEGLSTDLFDSLGEWKDKPASDWFAPLPAEINRTPATSVWETPAPSNDWWSSPKETTPEVTNPWKPAEQANPWQNWGSSTWEQPKQPEVKEQPAPKVPEWNGYRPYETPRPSQEQRPQGPTWGELAQQAAQWFQEQMRPREKVLTQEELDVLASQRLEFEEQASQQFLETAAEIEGLQPETWREASLEDRIQALVECAGAYQEAFGLGDLQLEIDPTLEEGSYGYCTNQGELPLVCVGEWVVQSDHPKEAVETLLHEMRHAYQFQYVAEAKVADTRGLVNFDVITTQNWIDSMSEYSQRVADYANSAIEQDADRHAKDLLTRLYIR